MKKAALIVIVFLATSSLFAQSDTSTVEQYCQVIVTPRLLSNKVTIDIDFGEEKGYWRDNRLKTYEGKLKKFNTVIDAMNFMGKDGWKFINAYPIVNENTTIYHFAFRKEFFKSEIFEN